MVVLTKAIISVTSSFLICCYLNQSNYRNANIKNQSASLFINQIPSYIRLDKTKLLCSINDGVSL